MDKKIRFKKFILPGFIVVLLIVNYSRLTGTENIRPIHIVSLIALGMGIGILLKNIVSYFQEKS
ncbi:MAG: hypothetical protein JSS91_09695 [Bacteroidetes bacterium]|nr:hypothetical protein [Bacteroidota bacterium]